MLKVLLITIITFASCLNVISLENYSYTTERISYNLGLSQSKVNAICKDHLGYIWIGTQHGLNRYDGFEIKKYFSYFHTSNSLWDNSINFIYEDKQQNLWIGTTNGLNKYDRKNDKFIRVNIDNASRSFTGYIEFDDKIIFSISSVEIVTYSKQSGEFSILKFSIPSTPNIRTLPISHFAYWDRERVLGFVRFGGLFLININTGDVELLCPMPIDLLLSRMFISGNNIWLSSLDEGILKIDKQTLEVTNYNASNSALSINLVSDFKQNPKTKDIWIATDGAGVFVFDQSFNLKKQLKAGPNIKDILPENSINRIFFDNEDVWLGTVRSGIVYLTPSDFEHFPPLNLTNYGPADKSILAIHEDKQGIIWLGTDGGGLSRFDKKTNLFEHFLNSQIAKITSIVEYDKNRLLVGSYRKGLFFFDKDNKKFYSVENDPLLNQIKKITRHKLFRDQHDNIWISDGTIWKITPQKNKKEQFTSNSNSYIFSGIDPIFFSVYEDRKNNIWFSSRGGIFSYNHNKRQFVHAVSLSNLTGSYGRLVYSITSDSQGNIIFGSDQGIFMFNPETKIVSDILTNNSLESRIYYTLYLTDDDQLWAATSEGLLLFRKDKSGKYYPLHLKSTVNFEYRFGSLLEASDGFLYLGSNEGFIRFRPENIKTDTTLVKPVITSFQLHGTERNAVKEKPLTSFVIDSASVTLPYSVSSYDFTFNVFDYRNKEQINYKYKLENFEEVWHDGQSRKAIYTSLPAGEYVFRVKAANSSGVWNEKSTNLHLNILPPWWQAIWFKMIGIIIFLIICITIWQESLNRAKLRNQVKLEKLEQEKIKEINQMKLRFFTNISHELKTPLTLIYAPLEQLVRHNSSPDEMRKLLPFLYRNARRMSQLVTQLLEFRKAEMSELSLNLEVSDLVTSCRDIIDHFRHQAEIENIKLLFEAQVNNFRFTFDRDKLFKMLSNLLSNALKHTGSGEKIEITLSRGGKGQAIIMVSDTGVGIPADEQTKIFERFYQVDHKEVGTGIGLAFTKRLVELHGGEIQVKSITGEGTTFTIILPQNDTESPEAASKKRHKAFEYPEPIATVPSMEESGKSSTKPVILIAEDEWELRQYLVMIFSDKYKVIVTKNGDEAFSKAIELMPDLIITDVMMPVMDGYELCDKVKHDLRVSHIPVIMLTAKSQTDSQIEGFEAGADAYVPKPFDNNLLFTQIETILRNRSILKERFSHDMDLKPEELPQSSADEKYLHKAICLIEMNLENPTFDVTAFVKEMGYSRTLVYNKTKAITGKPIKDFILHIRLKKASYYLKNSEKSIKEIAISCGFSDPTYFSTVFKRYYKMSPSEHRNAYTQTK